MVATLYELIGAFKKSFLKHDMYRDGWISIAHISKVQDMGNNIWMVSAGMVFKENKKMNE